MNFAKYVITFLFSATLCYNTFAETPLNSAVVFGNSLVDTDPVELKNKVTGTFSTWEFWNWDLGCGLSDAIEENQSFLINMLKYLGIRKPVTSAWTDLDTSIVCGTDDEVGVLPMTDDRCNYVHKFAKAGAVIREDAQNLFRSSTVNTLWKAFYGTFYGDGSLVFKTQIAAYEQFEQDVLTPNINKNEVCYTYWACFWCSADECTKPESSYDQCKSCSWWQTCSETCTKRIVATGYREKPEVAAFSWGGNDFFYLMKEQGLDSKLPNNDDLKNFFSDGDNMSCLDVIPSHNENSDKGPGKECFQKLNEVGSSFGDKMKSTSEVEPLSVYMVDQLIMEYKADLFRISTGTLRDAQKIIALPPLLAHTPSINDIENEFLVTLGLVPYLNALQARFNNAMDEYCNSGIINNCHIQDIDDFIVKGFNDLFDVERDGQRYITNDASKTFDNFFPGQTTFEKSDYIDKESKLLCESCDQLECLFMDSVHPNIATNTIAACIGAEQLREKEEFPYGSDSFNYDNCIEAGKEKYIEGYTGIQQEEQGVDQNGNINYSNVKDNAKPGMQFGIVQISQIAGLLVIVGVTWQVAKHYTKKKTKENTEATTVV